MLTKTSRKEFIKYWSPRSTVSELECESPLLAESVRLHVQVDELKNVNQTVGSSDEPTYFEYEF